MRVSEAHLREGVEREFVDRLVELVSSFPQRYAGLAVAGNIDPPSSTA